MVAVEPYPAVQEAIKKFMNKEPFKASTPMNALQSVQRFRAACLRRGQGLLLLDVTPLSLALKQWAHKHKDY
jgi:molecular chaperone DnaK (HSP70)